jgi:invasion protein IalB
MKNTLSSLLFVALISGLLFPFPAMLVAQTDLSPGVGEGELLGERPGGDAEMEQFQDWTVRCERVQEDGETVRVCEMLQQVTVEETGETIMEVAVGFVPERELPVALFTVPLGVRLQPGLLLTVDENEPVRIAIEICGPDGCLASMLFDEDMLNQFMRGAAGTVRIRDARDQSFDLPMSMMGFTAALERLREQ